MTTAKIIAEQIGKRAFFMMGAKNLVDVGNGLTWKVGRNDNGVTHVTVTLTPLDFYDLKFQRVRGTKVVTTAEVKGIYADMVHRTIEQHTGLRLSL